jgi:hypothetical protein
MIVVGPSTIVVVIGELATVTETVVSESVDSVTVWMTVIGAAEGVWPPSTLTTEYVAGRGRASVGVVSKAVAMMTDLNEYRMLDLKVCKGYLSFMVVPETLDGSVWLFVGGLGVCGIVSGRPPDPCRRDTYCNAPSLRMQWLVSPLSILIVVEMLVKVVGNEMAGEWWLGGTRHVYAQAGPIVRSGYRSS